MFAGSVVCRLLMVSMVGLNRSTAKLVIRTVRIGEEEAVRQIVNPNLWTVVRWGLVKRVFLLNKNFIACLGLAAVALYWFSGFFTAVIGLALLQALAYGVLYWTVKKQQLKTVSHHLNDVKGNYIENERSNLWVAEFAGRIIGCVAVAETSRSVAVLRSMSVDQSYQGLGVGKRLLEVLIAFCKEHGYEEVKLGTTEFQKAAQALYEKYGFVREDDMHVPLPLGTRMGIRRYSLKLKARSESNLTGARLI